MPATSEDAISAPPATIDFERQAAPARQEPAFAEPGTATGPSKLPPSIASAFAAAAYALQHGEDAPGTPAAEGRPGAAAAPSSGQGTGLMPGLYASMIGEPSRDYYLRLFERFDALGKPLPTWNLAAGLFTLPWCGLRGLWHEGGLYALAAGGTGLVWGLLLRPALGLPPPIAHGIDATLVLLAIAIPGLGANALYWHHVRRHTLQTIGEAPNMAEAHERLSRHAATPLRKRMAVAAGVVLAAAAGAGAWALSAQAHFMAAPTETAPSQATPAAAPAAAAPAVEPPKTEVASTPAPTALPQEPAAQTQAQAEARPDAQPPSPTAGTAVSGTVEPMPVVAAAQAAGAVAAAAVTAGPVKAALAPARPPAPVHTPAPAAPTPAPAKPSKLAAESKPAKPGEPAAKAAAPAKPAATALEPGNYYVNIGVFSEAGNAARVVERLEKARLPTLSQTLHSNKGEIVRVRSGPFARQRSADQAAGKIRAMGLEATVFHHAPQESRSARR